MTVAVPVEGIGVGGSNVPVTLARGSEALTGAPIGASRYEAPLPGGPPLETLLVNRDTDTLVVAFHGSTLRSKYTLPRFEWLNTLLGLGCSSLYFSDPGLRLSNGIELTWYTGWADLDLPVVLAEWSQRAAETVGASRVVFVGSSGGGFAALQVAARVPGSVVVAFNSQTHIADYRYLDGRRAQAQAWYVKRAMPHLVDEFKSLPQDGDWSTSLGVRTSARLRYVEPVECEVVYVQNVNDASHMRWHYGPFRRVVESSPNVGRVRWVEYDGPGRHEPPSRGMFRRTVESVMS